VVVRGAEAAFSLVPAHPPPRPGPRAPPPSSPHSSLVSHWSLVLSREVSPKQPLSESESLAIAIVAHSELPSPRRVRGSLAAPEAVIARHTVRVAAFWIGALHTAGNTHWTLTTQPRPATAAHAPASSMQTTH
jgi:hypothetical protein